MNRWEVYSFLKLVNGQASMAGLKKRFPGIRHRELREGIIEYNLMASREQRFQKSLVTT